MEARRLTPQELKQGWYAMACGCHAHVFRADLAVRIPVEAIEYCPIVDCGGLVPIGVVRKLTENTDATA